MSNAGLGVRDSVGNDQTTRTPSHRPDADFEPAFSHQARQTSRPAGRAYAPRAARPYDSGRTRIDADGVRTIKIRGQATPPRRRPAVSVSRYDQHPDRAAQWALFLGVFMVVVAIITGS
ncbi:MAG: hypothetical protein WAO61_08615 [Solirubrobacterales bacterium]